MRGRLSINGGAKYEWGWEEGGGGEPSSQCSTTLRASVPQWETLLPCRNHQLSGHLHIPRGGLKVGNVVYSLYLDDLQ